MAHKAPLVMTTATTIERCVQGDVLWAWLGETSAEGRNLVVGPWETDKGGAAMRDRLAAVRGEDGIFGLLEFGPAGYPIFRCQQADDTTPAVFIDELGDWIMEHAEACPPLKKLLGTTFSNVRDRHELANLELYQVVDYWSSVGRVLGLPLEAVPPMLVASALRFAGPDDSFNLLFEKKPAHLVFRPTNESRSVATFAQERMRLSGPAGTLPSGVAAKAARHRDGYWVLFGGESTPNFLSSLDKWVKQWSPFAPELLMLQNAMLAKKSASGVSGGLRMTSDWTSDVKDLQSADFGVSVSLEEWAAEGGELSPFWFCRNTGNGVPTIVLSESQDEIRSALPGPIPKNGVATGYVRLLDRKLGLKCDSDNRKKAVRTFLRRQQKYVPSLQEVNI